MSDEKEKTTPAEVESEPYLPGRKHFYPDFGPTPIEHSRSVFAEITQELGFTPNERLRMIGVEFVNLLKVTPEPDIPADMDEDFDCPDDVIALIRQYQATAEEMLKESPDQERRSFIRESIGLDLTYADMFFAGGWKKVARRRVYTAHQFANEMDTQYPEIFARIAEVTKEPSE